MIQEFEKMITSTKWKEMANVAECGLHFAHSPISNIRVGIGMLAYSDIVKDTQIFMGSNLEIATSLVFHAERVALLKALSTGYWKPLALVLVSNSVETKVPLCGYCRQDYMYVAPEMKIRVYDHKVKKIIRTVVLKDIEKYAYTRPHD
jgi:cytidine deaminase